MDIYLDDVKVNNIIVIKRYNVPSPQRAVDVVNVQGRTPLYIDRGFINDVEVKFTLGFITQVSLRNIQAEVFKRIFNNAIGKKLVVGDDMEHYRKVKHVIVSDTVTEGTMYNHFDVTFICDPIRYMVNSPVITFTGQTTFRNAFISRPVYIITGEGNCTITLNGKSVTINVGGSVTIDTDKMLAYNGTNWSNYRVIGSLEDLKIDTGMICDFTVTNGFNVRIELNQGEL